MSEPKRKRKVMSSLPKTAHHRSDFVTCPHCEEELEQDLWDKKATILVTSIVHAKHGSVAVVSECPTCFELSWVHRALISFDVYYDEIAPEWIGIANEELDKRRIASIREWATSLCINCAHVKNASSDTSSHRSCIRGFGPAEQTECEKFIRL
jgi:hypothetical protein